MEFRLLGPVEVEDEGQPLPLGGRQRRTLLSLLLVHAGEPVTTDRLVDELWGEDQPPAARKTVQAHVAHLRRMLNRHEEVLAGVDGGYLLQVEASAIDVRRFEELVEEGRRLLREDPEAAAAALDASLRLFRGAPLSGVADDAFTLRVEASRLEELRLAAIEARLQARLAAGHLTEVIAEAERLVAEHPLRERLWAVLMLALYRSGRQSEALRAFSRVRQVLAEELGIEPSGELRGLEQRILDQDPALQQEMAPTPATGPAPAATVVRNPYKGLRPFDEADAADFFGREDLVRRLEERLASRRGVGGLVVLAGPSGAGKSSAVRAGLVPALRERGVVVAVMFPGSDPLHSLARVLGEALQPGEEAEVGDVDLAELSGELPVREPLVIVVDQAEELFTVAGPTQTGRFLDLVTSAKAGDRSPQWVMTVRADFLDRLLMHPGLGPRLEESLVLVPPLQEHEIAAAVVNPARRVGVEAVPELVSEIVRDVAARPSALPLLQYALTDSFERRRGDALGVEDYRAAGGISGALSRRADEVFLAFDDARREAARQLLLRLIAVTDEGERVRRRTERHILLGLPVDREALEGVIERLGAQRLLTFDQDPDSGRGTVEIAHEALIAEWPRLGRWVDEARDDLRMQRRLAAARDEWRESGSEASFLLRGARLAEMESWSVTSPLELTEEEREFLEAGRLAEDSERRRLTIRRRIIGAVMAAAALAVAVSALVAFAQRNQARASAQVATVRELAAASVANLDVDPERSLLLALQAIEAGQGTVLPEAEEALHRAILAGRLVGRVSHGGEGIAHFSPDGGFFVTSGEDPTTAQVWRVEPLEPAVTLVGHEAPVLDAVYHPDGTRIATTSFDGTVRIWDAVTGEPGPVFQLEEAPPLIPVFSWDGSSLAASTFSGTVWVWDVGTGETIWRLSPPEGTEDTLNLEFSPDGSLLVVAPTTGQEVADFGAHVWDLASGELVQILTGHLWVVKDVGFTPDGELLVTASWDTTVKVWEVGTWENVRTFFGHNSSVWDLQVSADGTRVASSGTNEVLVWDLRTLETSASLVGHTGIVDGIDLSPDGDLLLTASFQDGTARLWDVSPLAGRELLLLPGPAGGFGGVAFSPDGRTLAASRGEGSVTFWELPSGREIATVAGPGRAVDAIAFSPDGRLVALAGTEGIELIEADGRPVATLVEGVESKEAVFSPSGSLLVTGSFQEARLWAAPTWSEGELLWDLGTYAAAFDPEERILVLSLDDGEHGIVEVLDIATREPLATLDEHGGPVWQIEFSPDGRRFATASLDTTVVIWDAATLEPVRRLEGHTGQVFPVDFHPTRPEVATASDDGTIKIWNVETGAVRLSLPVPPTSDLAYSPDGHYLAGISPEGVVAVYVLDLEELVATAHRRLTRWWTEAECLQYLHASECPPPPPGLGF